MSLVPQTLDIVGGVFHGGTYQVNGEQLRDWQYLDVIDDETGAEEPYIVRLSEDGWVLVSAEAVTIPDRDPDEDTIMYMRLRHIAMGGELLTMPCNVGEHLWTEWTETPGGNGVRNCHRCHMSQGKVV